jgi:putative aldouronate transport system substrate-binding protein
MRAFTYNDPDGNGADDTYGYFGQGDTILLWTWAFAPAFGAGQTKMVNGEIQPPYIQPEWAQWLKYMNRLYKDGILDPDFVTSNNQAQQEKASSGKYGAWLFFWHITEQISRSIPRETWTPIAPPLGPDGKQSHYLYGGPLRQWIGISADSEHADKVLQILDWGLSQDGGRYVQAGLEGMDYDIVNGDVVIREDRKGVSFAWRRAMLGLERNNLEGQYGELVAQVWGELGTQWLEYSNQWGAYDEIGLLLPAFPETVDYDLQAQANEFVYQAILGQVDIDAEFDDWVTDWRASGGDIWIEKATQYYLENLR